MSGDLCKRTFKSTYVAFLDVLGFKEIVRHTEHAILERLYENTIVANVQQSLTGGRFVVVDRNDQKLALADMKHAKVNSLIVSDSILFWSDNDSMRGFVDIVGVVRNFLCVSLFCGIPIRGAIVLGPMSLFVGGAPSPKTNIHQSIFGRAIVDALTAEQDQQWSGCSVTEECVDNYRRQFADLSKSHTDLASVEYLVEKKMLVRYPIPRKNGCSEEWAIDWVNASRHSVGVATVESAFSMHGKSIDQKGIQEKLNNTLGFVRCVNPNAENQP